MAARPATIMELTPRLMAAAKLENRVCISSSRQKAQIKDRTFTIEFLDTGARAFDFTFG